jgi:hypothetical protein
MSLYFLQKVLYDINRDPAIQMAYKNNPDTLLAAYHLLDEERLALIKPDIGLLYVLGVNGQILMHFAAFHQIEWDDYLDLMRQGIAEHGEVRAGVYKMTGSGKSFTANTEVKSDK